MTPVATQAIFLNEEEVLNHRLITFHRERVELIRADKVQPGLNDSSRLVVHLIPQQALVTRKVFTALELKSAADQGIKSLGSSHQSYGHSRFSADGELFSSGENVVRSYAQLFRSGIYEGVMSGAVFLQNPQTKILREDTCEEAMLLAMSSYVKFARKLALECPIWIIASLLGCEGAKICRERSWASECRTAIDREIVWLPEAKIESFDAHPETLLRPVFDVMFNAAGLERSFHYDEDGKRQVVR